MILARCQSKREKIFFDVKISPCLVLITVLCANKTCWSKDVDEYKPNPALRHKKGSK